MNLQEEKWYEGESLVREFQQQNEMVGRGLLNPKAYFSSTKIKRLDRGGIALNSIFEINRSPDG